MKIKEKQIDLTQLRSEVLMIAGVDDVKFKSATTTFKAIVSAIAGFTADRIIRFADRAGVVMTMPADLVSVANATRHFRVNETGTDIEVSPVLLRPLATAQPVYYISPTGLSTNDGLSPATPLLTLAEALNKLTRIDCNGFDPIINVAAGVYLFPDQVFLPNLVGVGQRCTITGPSTAIFRCTRALNGGIMLSGAGITKYRLQGLRIESLTASNSLYHKLIEAREGPMEFDGLTFAAPSAFCDAVISFGSASVIQFTGTTTLSGTFRWIFDCVNASINLTLSTWTGTATFSVFLNCSSCGIAAYDVRSTGTFTGKRHELINSHIRSYAVGVGSIGSIAGTYSYPTTPS